MKLAARAVLLKCKSDNITSQNSFTRVKDKVFHKAQTHLVLPDASDLLSCCCPSHAFCSSHAGIFPLGLAQRKRPELSVLMRPSVLVQPGFPGSVPSFEMHKCVLASPGGPRHSVKREGKSILHRHPCPTRPRRILATKRGWRAPGPALQSTSGSGGRLSSAGAAVARRRGVWAELAQRSKMAIQGQSTV